VLLLKPQQHFSAVLRYEIMTQGSVLIHVPVFVDDEVFIDESETRLILTFYWPSASMQIEAMSVGLETRRFAQQVLIAGVNASYAMGYVSALFDSLGSGPRGGVAAILKKLGRRSAKHWFRNAGNRSLQDLKIYESARKRVAINFYSPFQMHIQGVALQKLENPRFFAHIGHGNRMA
jgi:hypothetical protein